MVTRFKTPEYVTWDNMQQRCTNSKNPAYANYGGRGITVCARWNSFENFLEDLGVKPAPDYELERKDNNANYTPENCKWIPAALQGLNKRLYKTNTSGIAGVRFDAKLQLWRVKSESMYIYNGKDFFEACCIRKAEDARSKLRRERA